LADVDHQPNDSELEASDIARARRGDVDAFERLYRRHLARVTALARWLVGPEEAEDAVQDVFIRVWQKLDTFAGQSAFTTWLHRVAVNLILRRRERAGRVAKREIQGIEIDPPAGRSEPELRMAIAGAVDRLPERARRVFVLHDMEGYRHEEIAALLGIDSGTSRSQLHRARMLLRTALAV